MLGLESLEQRLNLSGFGGTYQPMPVPGPTEVVGTPSVISIPNLPAGFTFNQTGLYEISQQPQDGTLTVNASGQFIYTPNKAGADSFTILVNDPTASFPPNGVTYSGYAYTVNVINQAAFQPPTSTIVENVVYGSDVPYPAGLFPVAYVDATGDQPIEQQGLPGQSETLVVAPKDGTFNSQSGMYTPNPGFTGTDTFTVKIHAATPTSTADNLQYFDAYITFNYTVVAGLLIGGITNGNGPFWVAPEMNSPGDTETSSGSTETVYNGSTLVESVTQNSPTQFTLSQPGQADKIVTLESDGTVNISQNGQILQSIVQPPTPEFPATSLSAAQITSQLSAVAGVPAIVSLENAQISALAAGNYQIMTEPTSGTIAVSPKGKVTYTSTGNATSDNFSIEVLGTSGSEMIYTVQVAISQPVVPPPAAVSTNVSVDNTSATQLDLFDLATGADPTQGISAAESASWYATSIVIVSAPQHGTLLEAVTSPTDPTFAASNQTLYTPDAGYTGSDSMTVEVHGQLPTAPGQPAQFFDTLLTVNFAVTAGTGTATASNTSDPFVIGGQTLTINAPNTSVAPGSGPGNDNLLVIDFTTATDFNINFNGYSASFSTVGATPITDIVYNGGTGDDIVDVTTVSGSDTAMLGAGTLSLSGPTYQITASGVEAIGLLGTASDTAIFTGSSSDVNSLIATPTATIMHSRNINNTSNSDLDPVYNAVDGYGVVVAQSGTSNDTANLYGAASGDNILYGSQVYSYIEGSGYNVQAVGFANVNAWSRSASDIASLYSDTGDQSTLVADSAGASLGGNGYTINANNFATVYATSQGKDSARLSGSSTEENEFIASDPYTAMSGPGYVVLTYNFTNVDAAASSGDDTAYFYGVSDHNAFTGSQQASQMIGTDAAGNLTYAYSADWFASVLASTLSASDTADLQGEAAGDQFIAGPIQNYAVAAALIGAVDAFTIQVFAFQQITATSAGDGGDYAALNDPPGTNTFTGQGKNASLATPLSTYTAVGFANVAATSDDQGTDDESVGAVDYALTMNGNWVNS